MRWSPDYWRQLRNAEEIAMDELEAKHMAGCCDEDCMFCATDRERGKESDGG